MKLRGYLIGLVLATVLAWACLIAIIKYFGPTSGGTSILVLFYLSLFVAASGVFALIGLAIRYISRTTQSKAGLLERSLRQGVLLSLIFVIALYLQSQDILAWWSLLIMLIVIGVIEWLLSKKLK